MKLTTPPLAPKTLAALQDLGIATVAHLQETGAAAAFLLLKAAGCTITKSTLWQLEALCSGVQVSDLDETRKTGLLAQIKNHPPVAVFPRPSEMENFMDAALQQAQLAAEHGEIPVGAVVVHQGAIIAAAHNSCIRDHNISHHAEIRALAAAGQILSDYRLDTCDVYITLEPCTMCASALIQARVRRVIFGAPEPKTGAAGSMLNLFENIQLNKHTAIRGGIRAERSKALLQEFFAARRG